jgi:hypothetical protein
MTVIPGMDAVLSTDAGIGFDVVDISNVKADAKNAESSKDAAVEVGGQKAVCWVAHSAKTGNFYMTDIGTSKVTEVSVDKNLNATIVKVVIPICLASCALLIFSQAISADRRVCYDRRRGCHHQWQGVSGLEPLSFHT